MTYYCTSLVFFIPTKNNKNFNKKELILFDDRSQKIIFRFKSKDEDTITYINNPELKNQAFSKLFYNNINKI